ncbi:hypothetical protein DMR35_15060 [Klebsiella variicola]|uniref:hypothetical protein n=1 Tax=Klebsiella variicola TaxID=244366 RepID=UPI000D747F9F|nr:hypothetical protein [Klebsiella variicola]PXJ98239.1 hypothetical protein DMR35_15060 [Klebsiella variicola]
MTITLQAVNELIASLESAGELSIKETKVMALAKAFKQLAAENVAMLRLLTDISENHVEYFSEGEDGMFAGVPLDYVSEINMYVSRDVNAENPFPAIDAYLAGIKADGVEMFALMFAEEAIKDNNITTGWKARASRAASEYAELLREGADK